MMRSDGESSSLVRACRDGYKEAARNGNPLAPRGILGQTHELLEELGSSWAHFARQWVPLEPGALKHEVRKLLKVHLRTALEESRPSLQGTGDIDEVATNGLHLHLANRNPPKARRVLQVITGAVFPFHPKIINDTVGGRTKCMGCDATFDISEHTARLLEHTLWDCQAHEHIRTASETRAALCTQRNQWPRCTQLHGIATVGLGLDTAELQLMMAEITGSLQLTFARKKTMDFSVHLWNRPFEKGSLLKPRSLRWHYDNGLRQQCLPRLIPHVIRWLSALHWGTTGGQVSRLELAIDFIATVGLSPCEEGEDIQVSARVIGRVITALERIHTSKGIAPLIPAASVVSVHSLRTLGYYNSSVRGYSSRPVFASPVTRHILEKQLYNYCVLTNSVEGFIPKVPRRVNEGPKATPQQKGSIKR
eukprot:TRINITY_DN545_c1_g1_i1.p1 TRINITY_DN545_c1_g1~~TRINITY_DN545_c1_g1_i1.p1  ORF type:complete len:421 (+),score=44.58 TRINITY_DN545_c1_g1_i1:937-2199(+)